MPESKKYMAARPVYSPGCRAILPVKDRYFVVTKTVVPWPCSFTRFAWMSTTV